MINSSTLDSYSVGARALHAKSLGSLALGAAALAGLATDAEAAIHNYTFTGVTLSTVNIAGEERLQFNVLDGSVRDILDRNTGTVLIKASSNKPYPGLVRTIGIGSFDTSLSFAGDNYSYVANNLIVGATISGSLDFVDYVNLVGDYKDNTLWTGKTGYVGFKHSVSNNYGWLKFTVNADATQVTLDAMAYNDIAGEAILAGQISAIPEPATSAVLLGLGAAGLAAYRRRKHIERAAA